MPPYSAEKHIEILAVAIQAHMTMNDLEELDLCYAPPYSSAKCPVNFTGFNIENALSGLVRQARWADVRDLPENAKVHDVLAAVRQAVPDFGKDFDDIGSL